MDEPEDDIVRNAQGNPLDADLTDETQDFRFLNLFNKAGNTSLPRRGEKDFEPDGTDLQDRVLSDSRQAMHGALLGERKHSSKQHVTATWRRARNMAQVDVARGPHFKSVGRADKSGTLWLLPEETIYLVERGNLECRWEEGVPMSLQGVYATCLDGCGGLERYQVYSYLKRAGYILARAPTFRDEDADVPPSPSPMTVRPALGTAAAAPATTTTLLGIFAQLFSSFFGEKPGPRSGPVVAPGTYRSYEAVYSRLSLIPSHHPPHTVDSTAITTAPARSPFRVAYSVWKPQPHFKKSDPPPPDFLVAVVSARETSLPTLAQLSALFDSVPVDAKAAGKNQFHRLKDGYRNVVVAVVDSGVTSFIKFADVGFADEPMYKWRPPSGRGRGGGGKSRGRGQGARARAR